MHENTNKNRIPLISISIPVFNEQLNIEELYKRVCSVATSMKDKCDMEFVFTDNNSEDDTWSLLTKLSLIDKRVKAIKFSKNVGFQNSIFANYMHTSGDAVMQIDADLQDPPEMLEDFFNLWMSGYSVVYGIREKREEGFFFNNLRIFGYWLVNKLSEHSIPKGAGDFRLLDRKVVDALVKCRSINPYIRGIIPGLGFKQIGIRYDRSARAHGESKFSALEVIKLGVTGIFNHSNIPLRIATYTGIVILFLSFIGSIYYIFLKIYSPNMQVGLASIHILVLFGIGLQSLLLGVLGEYLLRIYTIIRKDPIAIVDSALNLDSGKLKL